MSSDFLQFAEKPDATAVLLVLETRAVRSRKSLQKLVYLLQECEGLRLGLDYRMYYYGPYSSQLDSRLEMLELLGVIGVDRDANDVPTYHLPEVETHFTRPEDMSERVAKVVSQFGHRAPNDLELLATVHFLAAHSSPVDDEQLFQRLRAWKGPKFHRREMDDALGELRQAGYLRD